VNNYIWASGFKYIKPVEKFVLTTIAIALGQRYGEELPSMAIAHLPYVAETCNLPDDQFARTMEQLMRRGLIRNAPDHSIELCTFIDPNEWNQRRDRSAEELPTNGKGKKD
jgi:hypothetical protein